MTKAAWIKLLWKRWSRQKPVAILRFRRTHAKKLRYALKLLFREAVRSSQGLPPG
jgi:hypothetical protein